MVAIFGCIRSRRAVGEKKLRRAVVKVVAEVAGPDARAWWSSAVEGGPVLILVITDGCSGRIDLTKALHAEWKRAHPSSRELEFIVLTGDDAPAISLVARTATELTAHC